MGFAGAIDDVQERDLQAYPELLGGHRLDRPAAGVVHEDDPGRGVAAELVVDRLDDVLVADPRLRVDPRLGERREGEDEALLGGLVAAVGVGGPAIDEAGAVAG